MALHPASTKKSVTGPHVQSERLCARWRSDDRGVTAVEFAMLIVPFMAVFMAILETSLFIFSQQSMQTAVENAHRIIMTGQAQGLNQSPTEAANAFKSALCQNMISVIDCPSMVKVDVKVGAPQPPSAYLDANGGFDDTKFGYNPGGRDAIVTVTAMAAYPLFMPSLLPQMVNSPGGKRLMQASYAFKNEPF